jgi:hypothetical protein
LPLHGSCFELYFEKAFCGESGAGNHLLPHLCQDGAQFINDDITPVEITAAATTIIPIKKLASSCGRIPSEKLKKILCFDKIRPDVEKFYLQLRKTIKANIKSDFYSRNTH